MRFDSDCVSAGYVPVSLVWSSIDNLQFLGFLRAICARFAHAPKNVRKN